MSFSIIAVLSGLEDSKKYKNAGKFTFPAHEKINPKEKNTPEYCLDVVKAAYSVLMRDKSSLRTSDYDSIQQLRDYLTGSQPNWLYQNTIKEMSSNSAADVINPNISPSKRKALDSINTKVISIVPNLMNTIHGMYDEYEEDVFVDSVDNESGAEQERAMFDALFDAKMSAITGFMNQTYGIPIGNEGGLPMDTSIDELEIYKDSGGFKTYWAESMEEAVHFTEQISDWNRTIKRKFLEDAVALNFLCARQVYDSSKRKLVWEYMDPGNSFIQHSTDKMFSDAAYGGYFTYEKIGTLVEMGFSSEKLLKAAKKYKDHFDNPVIQDWNQYERTFELDSVVYDFKIPVFHYYWKDVDVTLNKKTTNNYGITTINERELGQTIKPLSKEKQEAGYVQEVYPTRKEMVYQCSWVVDTDMVYNFGIRPNQGKNGAEAVIPIKAWRGITTNPRMVFGSILEGILPFVDHLQLAWEKYQDALSKWHFGGYKVNLRLLQHLKWGGAKLDPKDAYELWWNTGIFPYMDVALGESYKGGDVSPVSRIESMTAEGITMFQNEIAFISQMIEKVTGINPVVLGSTQQGVTATATNVAAGATNNVIRPLITGIFEMKEGLASLTAMDLPILLRNVKEVRESYSRAIGEESVKVLIDAEHLGAEYGLTMNARPDAEAKQRLITMLETAIQRGRDGEASINIGQAMYIMERIESGGNFKKLQRQVEFMVRKSDEEMFNKKRQLIQEQSQQQSAQAQVAAQAQMQADAQKFQMDEAGKDKQLERDMMLAKHQQELDIEQEIIIKAIDQDEDQLPKISE